MPEPDRDQAIKTFQAMAETHVESMQSAFCVTLCYDEDSVFLLDDLISKGLVKPDDDNFHLIIVTVGSYLGETLVRVLGGRWEFDEKLEWVVDVDGKKRSPFSMVIKRFSSEEAVSISEWYKDFKAELGRE